MPSGSDFNNSKILILGGGAVVAEFYLPALRLLNAVPLVCVIDSSSDSLKALQKSEPRLKVQHADFRECLENLDEDNLPDAAVVALPNTLHAEAVELALKKGLHVLCEKPLALHEEDCLRLAHLSKEKKRVLVVGMMMRLLPSVIAAREALENNLIGTIKSVDIENGERYAWFPRDDFFLRPKNGGVLADMGVHFLDILTDLIGNLEPVTYGDDWRGGVEANCEFSLRSKRGIPVRLRLSRTYLLRNTITFRGERGEIILKKDTLDRCFFHSNEAKNIQMELYPERPFQKGKWPPVLESCFAEELAHFFEATQNKKRPLVTAWDAAKTVSLIEWAYNERARLQTEESLRGSKEENRALLPPSKTLVTGGTGFIGSNLIRRLYAMGISDIAVPVRRYQTCSEIGRFPVKLKRIDLLNYDEVKAAVNGRRFVFHLAYGRDGPNASRVTVNGTKNVVNAAIECNAESVIVLSTVYVFGRSRVNELIEESSPYRSTSGEYSKSKAKMEKWCLSRARNSGSTRVVVLNPSCVYGPEGKVYTKLPVDMAKEGSFCWIEGGSGIANYTFIDNLIDAMIIAATCKEAAGQRFIINDGSCTWREFLLPLIGISAGESPSFTRKELLDREKLSRKNIKDVITHLLRDRELIAIFNRIPFCRRTKEILFRRFPRARSIVSQKRSDNLLLSGQRDKQDPVLPPAWFGEIFGPEKTKFSSRKAKEVLGWEPRVGLDEGMEVTRAWLRSANIL